MKLLLPVLLVIVSASTLSCSTSPDKKAHNAISAYLQKQKPGYEPVSFHGGYRWTRKDSAWFVYFKNGGLLDLPGLSASQDKLKPYMDSLEKQGNPFSV